MDGRQNPTPNQLRRNYFFFITTVSSKSGVDSVTLCWTFPCFFSDFCQRRPRGTSIEPPSWTLTMQSDYCVLECRYRNKIDGVIGFGVSTTIKNDFEIRIIIILCHRREWIEMNEKQNCSLSYLKNTFFIFIIISTIFIFTILANAIYV